MNLREEIKKDIEDKVSGMVGKWDGRVDLFRPDDPQHGDYSTNVALKLFSEYSSSERKRVEKSEKVGSRPDFVKTSTGRQTRTVKRVYQSPVEFAKKLADSFKNQAYIEKLEVKEPGFLNFFVKSGVLYKEVGKLLKKDKFGSQFSNKKVIIEFTDPNPFKEFHVGHLYSNSVGEAISRMFEAVGAKVKRANYQGDVGLHVAKCIWGMRKAQDGQSKRLSDLARGPLEDRIDFLGTAYAAGANAYETDALAKKEITEINKEIYGKLEAIEEYKLGKAWSLENFEAIYERLGTKFDLYYFESEVGQKGAKIVGDNLKKGVFEESEGAIIFPGDKYGLHNRVFITSQGLPTYEAKELGLAFRKYEDFGYDLSIIVTGSEIIDYFKVLIAAIARIDPKLAAKNRHIAHGMLRMPGGKISSRLGNVVSAQYLLDEAKKRALKLAADKRIEKSTKVGEVAEKVAVGAVKYALLKGNANQDINFSFDEALALEGNSGPYLQYTYARARSVIEKGQGYMKTYFSLKKRVKGIDLGHLASEEELLLRTIGHFEEAVVDAVQNFSPNTVANFLFDLAQKYNNLYNNLRIVDSKEPDRSRRLFLTEVTAQILQKGLFLLGIEAPSKM